MIKGRRTMIGRYSSKSKHSRFSRLKKKINTRRYGDFLERTSIHARFCYSLRTDNPKPS